MLCAQPFEFLFSDCQCDGFLCYMFHHNFLLCSSDTDGPSTSGTHLMKVPSKEGEISFGMDEVEGVKTESSKVYLNLFKAKIDKLIITMMKWKLKKVMNKKSFPLLVSSSK